jgi:hypothetical protein
MKVYSRQDFLKLPEGTFFSQGNKWCFQGLSIKGHSFENDFMYVDLLEIESESSGDWADKLEDSLTNGSSYPSNSSSSREGLYDDSDVFLVLELEDLNFISHFMIQQIKDLNAIKKRLE